MMTEGNFVQPAIPRFDGHYDHWSMLMENFLRSKEYWSLVETGYKKLDKMKLKDLKVKNYLFQKNTSKQIWDSMKKKYEGNERVKRSILQALRKEFETLEMKSGEGVSDYFSRVMFVANKMRVHGEQMRDVTIVEKILRSLSEKFNYIVCSIEESKDIDRLSIDELQSSLIVHKQKFHRHKGEEQALKVTHEESTWGRGRGRGSFRGRGRGRGRQSFNKATIECYKCHKLGHFQYECPSWDREANYAEEKKNKKGGCLVLRFGLYNHMCGDKALFCDFTESFRQMVKLGNNSKMTVMGKGNIKLKMNGLNHIVTEVFYVPELKNNLLSIGQLQEKGLAILIQHGKCKMSANRMFTLLVASQPKKPACFHTATQDLSHLWTLQNKKMVNGLPQFEASKIVCTDCMVGKQHRDPIPKKNTWRASSKLQLIHADICGPITPISNRKKRYLISFIDDFSRKVWIYFLVEKSEALVIFKQYKSCFEKETGSYIKCLRTDRGGKFTSQEFDEFCKENGIKRQLTAAYTPQQNGVAERKNRAIMNMVRSMLSEKKTPKTFWPEVVNWIVHILNRRSWSGVKPSVEHFRVFGCISHVHVPDVKRTKLKDKSFTCVLLGVSEESKAYRLYDPIAKKIVISRDVVFEEEKSWDWDKSYEEQVVAVLEWGDNEKNAAANNEDEAEIEDGSSAEEVAADSPNLVEEEGSLSSIEGRVRRPPVWMRDYETGEGLSEEEDETNLALFASADPLYFEEAVKSAKWRTAMDSEIKSIEKNDTWVLTDLPAGAKKIGVKWIYKTKLNEHGNVDKYKARLVAKGYTQQHGVDYTEVFAPMARMDTVRIITALAAQKSWTIYQLDVKSVFLHGELSEEVFVEQPRGYEQKDNPHKVYKLKKALYRLKQAPRAWFSRIEAHLVNEGFERCHSEHTLFVKTSKGGKILIVSLYVDDLIFTGNDESMFYEFKSSMMREFDMTDLGKMRYFLGVEVLQKTDGIYIRQKKYVLNVLKRFGMEESNFVYNPIVPGFKVFKDENGVKVDATFFKQVVGSLMYLTATRPDLMFVIAKRVLRYLQGTTNLGIFYKKGGSDKLVAFTDSDYAGDLEDRKSTSGYPIVSLSTIEAEFIAATSCTCEAVWMRRILEKLSHTQGNCTTVFCDNSSTIKLSKNPVMHGQSKHIDVRFHFLHDLTKEGIANMMTKPLKIDTFLKLRKLMGVCEVPDVN
uniref:Retrovirus-related Pol polyprotein from transposon TNT 1-94 n=1 Tax=Nelumbo nucifera TaxID=4432 RepID=A0A822Z7Q1_NELNU|nr:TPA_asm: hypothetical protein HUJ06_013808 [Nelumbo nucifera]